MLACRIGFVGGAPVREANPHHIEVLRANAGKRHGPAPTARTSDTALSPAAITPRKVCVPQKDPEYRPFSLRFSFTSVQEAMNAGTRPKNSSETAEITAEKAKMRGSRCTFAGRLARM